LKENRIKGLNTTERKLLEELNRLGLYPECQYKISEMRVDFAFPKYKIVVEVDGKGPEAFNESGEPYHNDDKDNNRNQILQELGWKYLRFTAKRTFNDTHKVALQILYFIDHCKKPQKMSKKNTIIGIAIAVIAFIIILIALVSVPKTNDTIPSSNSETKPQEIVTVPVKPPTFVTPPAVEPLIVNGTKTDVVITNNQDHSVSVKVTYNIYSTWFGINQNETKVFNVGANTTESFRVYNNDGCRTAPCGVSIIDFKEI